MIGITSEEEKRCVSNIVSATSSLPAVQKSHPRGSTFLPELWDGSAGIISTDCSSFTFHQSTVRARVVSKSDDAGQWTCQSGAVPESDSAG
jgi:hypothetical protein